MNLPTNNQEEGTRDCYREENQSYLTVDGESWDVSNLLDSLPHDNTKKQSISRKLPPQSSGDSIKEERKLPASRLKKAYHQDTLTLKPVPKYDWRSERHSPSSTPASLKKQQQQRQQQDESPEASSEGLSYQEGFDSSTTSYTFADSRDGLDESQQAFLSDCSLHQSDLIRQEQQQQRPALPKDFQRSLLEVFPGVEMPLRGSLETQDAIARNFIATVRCLDCTLQINCIRDAEYVLCPLCHCVSPMELSCSSSLALQGSSFGVGLGYCEDEL